MNRWLRLGVFVAATLSVSGAVALANGDKDGSLSCRDNWYSDRLVGQCEIREQKLPAGGVLTVDARRNGGVSIKGWDQNEILVRARVQAAAATQAEADQLAKQIKIETSGGKIFAVGPESRKDSQWNVSYEIFAPRRTDLSLEAYNGGIYIADITGRIEFNAHNGGVVLKRVGGTVRGGTTNGGLVVELVGTRWDGEELDVKTTNGGIVLSVPENYSAHLETGTVNGHLSIDFPITVQGRISRELAVNLGGGGATVRAMTTNGGVKIKRTGSDANY
ncbi:MAG: DUF4097 family beta strand repeat-containing protein [Pyrinomonadaceae bacterium]